MRVRLWPFLICTLLFISGMLAPAPTWAQAPVLQPQPTTYQFPMPPAGGTIVTTINDRGQAIGRTWTDEGWRPFVWQYGELTKLPTFGIGTEVRAINNRGQIVGFGPQPGNEVHALLWDKGVTTDLGLLHKGENTFAIKINNVGQVVGQSAVNSPAESFFATACFIWDKGTMTDLGNLGSRPCVPVAMNDNGQVVGYSGTGVQQNNIHQLHAFLWDKGVMTDLGTLGGFVSFATAINNHGQIVGYSSRPPGEDHAFLWQNSAMTDLGTLGGTFSKADSINDQGLIAGESLTANKVERAVFWRDDKIVDLGIPTAQDDEIDTVLVNNAGQAVARAHRFVGAQASNVIYSSFFWDKGVTTNLGILSNALDLNARGQVVGAYGAVYQFPVHSYLWQPGLAGLTLWNQLDSQAAVEHSAYGPGGTVGGGEFVPGRNGSVYSAQFNQTGLVSFPKEVVNGPRGAIHFWAKLTDFPAAIGWGQNPGLVGIRDTAGSYYGLAFNARDLHGNGGLCAAAGQFFTAGTGAGSDKALLQAAAANGWTYTDALGGADPAQWHHYALVWDEDGILGLGDGTLKVAALVDGKLITQHTQNDPPLTMNTPMDGRLALLDDNTSLLQGSVEYSDLTIWSYARLDAAVLPPPQAYLPALSKGQ